MPGISGNYFPPSRKIYLVGNPEASSPIQLNNDKRPDEVIGAGCTA